jgi:hypothetical protein
LCDNCTETGQGLTIWPAELKKLNTEQSVLQKHDFFGLYRPIYVNPYPTSKKYASNTRQTRAKMIRSLEHWPLHRSVTILPSKELAGLAQIFLPLHCSTFLLSRSRSDRSVDRSAAEQKKQKTEHRKLFLHPIAKDLTPQ